MVKQDLIIINNEKINKEKKFSFCENVDMKSIPEELNKSFNVTVIARNSKIKCKHQIDLDNIQAASNIFNFLLHIFKTFKRKNAKYLIISVTPYTFFSSIFLLIFKKKYFIYLRSDGYEEYKSIFGIIGPLIYHTMFKVVTLKAKVISCQARLFSFDKSAIVSPSELDQSWERNVKDAPLNKVKLLYVGRVKVEKGIFSLLKILDEMKIDYQLSIVGKQEGTKVSNKKISFIGYGFNSLQLIEIYDEHNISILPSFTEAHPKVIDESLVRMRPVIIFDEILHVVKNKKGIFVSERNAESLTKTIKFIMENYKNIKENMAENKLPTKKEFILQMNKILDLN